MRTSASGALRAEDADTVATYTRDLLTTVPALTRYRFDTARAGTRPPGGYAVL